MEMERAAFNELRADVSMALYRAGNETYWVSEQVTKQSSNLRKNARIIDELDVTIGFAELAVEMNLVRPVVTDE
jgi:DNA mismatch repair ATPase MutS